MNYDGVDDEPNEEYLLLAWPAPPAPDQVHKQGVEVNGSRTSSLVHVVPRPLVDTAPPRPNEVPISSPVVTVLTP